MQLVQLVVVTEQVLHGAVHATGTCIVTGDSNSRSRSKQRIIAIYEYRRSAPAPAPIHDEVSTLEVPPGHCIRILLLIAHVVFE